MSSGVGSLETGLFRSLNAFVEPWVREGWFSPGPLPYGLVLLEVPGRRSGAIRRLPLMASVLGDMLLLATVRGRRSQWPRNLAAQQAVRYWMNGRERSARPLVFLPGATPPPLEGESPPVRALAGQLASVRPPGWAVALLLPQPEVPSPRA